MLAERDSYLPEIGQVAMSTIAEGASPRETAVSAEASSYRLLCIWLYAVAGLILAMVLVGGATRLTNSGLSITEWKPLLGAIPPLSQADWQDAFAKYQQIPEYQLINKGMSLDAFKAIYWWEWAHRFLGRFIGVAFFVPFLVFWLRGAIPRGLMPKLAGVFVLGGAQGALGWYMVKSGLAERTDVSQYRLAAHLGLAVLIYGATLWVAFGLGGRGAAARERVPVSLKAMAALFALLVFVQIILGGFVAGTDAGLSHNTWPLMDGAIIPDGLGAMQPWYLNLFENVLTVQFNHRMLAYAIALVAALDVMLALRSGQRAVPFAVLAAVLAQITLGVFALLSHLELGLALAHQAGAVLLFGLALYQLHSVARLVPAFNRR
jgi:cytochrome c oxidase assembly protein subunit 15